MENGYIDLGIPFAKISTNPVKDFLVRLFLQGERLKQIVIITPLMGPLGKTRFSINKLAKRIDADKTRTYIITRKPKPEHQFHRDAIEELLRSNYVEVRYNNSLHAKLYIFRTDSTSFGMFGSGNLTKSALEKNIEIGMLIFPTGRGKDILHQLMYWGSVRLRTIEGSKLIRR